MARVSIFRPEECKQVECLLNYERFRSIVDCTRLGVPPSKHLERFVWTTCALEEVMSLFDNVSNSILCLIRHAELHWRYGRSSC
jgi:hypothetical protein